MFDQVRIRLGEIRCLSLLGLEGLTLWVELLVGSRSCSEVISEGGPYTIETMFHSV